MILKSIAVALILSQFTQSSVLKRDVVEDIDFNITAISCATGEGMCMSGDCIALSKICDGVFDCSDNSDEQGCASGQCKAKEFVCGNKNCIPKKWTCDGENDCGDNSDELDCSSSVAASRCGASKFACNSGECIAEGFQCDGVVDCADGSDETGCD